MTNTSLLVVNDLTVHIPTDDELVVPVKNVSFTVNQGQIVAIVGMSGAGKTMVGKAIFNLLPPRGFIANGSIMLQGQNLRSLTRKEIRNLCGNSMAFIFQNPMTALHPAFTIGWQLAEVLTKDKKLSPAEARLVALEKLALVGITDPEQRFDMHPHEFSGGMAQRVMIAMSLMSDPQLLIADEPTTGLDVTIQLQVLKLLKSLQQKLGFGVILVTHDMGVVAQTANHVCVMRQGKLVEQAPVKKLFGQPQHDYTRELLDSVLVLGRTPLVKAVHQTAEPLLTMTDVQVHYSMKKKGRLFRPVHYVTRAVDGVALSLGKNPVGLVGESGCGKTTLARLISGSIHPTSGEVRFGGKLLRKMNRSQRFEFLRQTAMVYQNPASSLDPRMTVAQIIAEPLVIHRVGTTRSRLAMVEKLLDRVHLERSFGKRFPHQLSGGEQQRVGIARALALQPKLLICDEPTSALDVNIQKGIIALFQELQDQDKLSLLFISHALATVEAVARDVIVMYFGRIVESGTAEQVIRNPLHPYTQALVAASPVPDPEVLGGQVELIGDPPSHISPPSGCPFHPRCVKAQPGCSSRSQTLAPAGQGRFISCEIMASA